MASVIAAVLVLGATTIALLFRPFAVLREPALRVPLVAALVNLPIAWSSPAVLRGGPSLQFSFAMLIGNWLMAWGGAVMTGIRCSFVKTCDRAWPQRDLPLS